MRRSSVVAMNLSRARLLNDIWSVAVDAIIGVDTSYRNGQPRASPTCPQSADDLGHRRSSLCVLEKPDSKSDDLARQGDRFRRSANVLRQPTMRADLMSISPCQNPPRLRGQVLNVR